MENPYTTPQSEGPEGIVPKPSQVTVFGILHILAALFGFGSIIVNSMVAQNPKATLLEAFQHDKESPTTFTPEALAGLDKALSLNIYFEVFGAILATMLLTSGLAMLLNARWGINLSNKYSLLSIILKLVSIALAIAIVLPGYQSFCDGISGGNETVVSTTCLIMKITVVASPFITMLYPALALFFLTKPGIKNYQATL